MNIKSGQCVNYNLVCKANPETHQVHHKTMKYSVRILEVRAKTSSPHGGYYKTTALFSSQPLYSSK